MSVDLETLTARVVEALGDAVVEQAESFGDLVVRVRPDAWRSSAETLRRTLGFDYGDFDAHDGLWSMCEKTRDDIVARMALVPRTLEARGLDATPLIQDKLARAGDAAAVAILDIILRDEVGHVAIGNHWFHHLCQARGLDAVALYPELVKRHEAPRLKPPFNEAARKAAGFTDAEMAFLLGLD